MKYKKILELVPKSEADTYTDETINEGVWMSHEHMASIDSKLTELDNRQSISDEEHQSVLKELNEANEKIGTKNKVISLQLEKIKTLENSINNLGQQSSGNGTTLEVERDEPPIENNQKLPGYLDPERPSNKETDLYLQRMARIKTK